MADVLSRLRDMTEMDDCSDIVTASLTLLSAGIMLVAGQIYLENYPTHPTHPSRQDGQPALISRAPSSTGWPIEPPRAQNRSAS